MGIGSNLGVEILEQEHRDALYEAAINEAAISVVMGQGSRESAFQSAKDLIEEQQEALSKGEPIETELSVIPKGKEAQVKAIASELREKFEYEL